MPLVLDTSGSNPNNRISGQVYALPAAQYRNFRCVISQNGPFFRNNHQVYIVQANNTDSLLTEGIDYLLGHKYGDASKQVNRAIYGSVCIINDALVGNIKITANYLGGNYTLTTQTVQAALARISSNPRDVSWEMITNIVDAFPVGPHTHLETDIAQIAQVIDGLADITAAILAQPVPITPQTFNLSVDALNDRIDLLIAQLANIGGTVSGSILSSINATIAALVARVEVLETFKTDVTTNYLGLVADTIITNPTFVYDNAVKSKNIIVKNPSTIDWQNTITNKTAIWIPSATCPSFTFQSNGIYKFTLRNEYSNTPNEWSAPSSNPLVIDTGMVMTIVQSVSASDVIIEVHQINKLV